MSKDQAAPEEEYFHRQDQERIRKLKEQMEAERAAKEAEELKNLHYLHCGKCGNKMETQVFKGVEIDVCGACGSVLLDPGELQILVGEDRGGVAESIAEFFSFTRRKR